MENVKQRVCSTSSVLMVFTIGCLMFNVNRLSMIKNNTKLKPATKGTYSDVGTLKPLVYTFGSREWRKYMPEIDDLLTKIEQGEVKWPVDIQETTDPKTTVINFWPSTGLRVGQTLSGTIQAKDFNKKNKQYGGDYFRASLMRIGSEGHQLKDGIAVMIEDFYNGTYGWKTIVPWPGRCRLLIELVHSSEAVVDLVLQRATLVNRNRGFLGIFDKDEVECDVMLSDSESPSCDFSQVSKGITWHCLKPAGSMSCPKEVPMYKITTKDKTTLGNQPLFKEGVTWQTYVSNSGAMFYAKGSALDMPRSKMKCDSRTGSMRFRQASSDRPSGYFDQSRWVSLLCDNHRLPMMRQCLKHKSVYFIGDSTMRQWYYSSLQSKLGLRDTGLPNDKFWSMPRDGVNLQDDILVHYRPHGSPLHNPGPPESRPYMVDTLQGINGTRPTAVVFNIGSHFLPYDPSVFMQRVAGIRNAVVMLHKRYPSVRFFIRGATRFRSSAVGPLSDWLYLRTDRILRGYFHDLPYVSLLDTWDMTFTPQVNVHASANYIENFILLFLSYYCDPLLAQVYNQRHFDELSKK